MSDRQLQMFGGDTPGGVPAPKSLPYQRHSEESKEAAESMEPQAGTLRFKVLDYIRSKPLGVTDEQIATALSMNPSTQRPRRVELFDGNFIKKDGTRPTSSGRSAAVWKAVWKVR